MSISPHNLWPEDIAVTGVVAPVTILKDQASVLGQRTKNLVEGRVKQGTGDPLGNNKFSYDFDLVAPALNNYRYHLFSIWHGVEFYPLIISSSAAFPGVELEVPNEEEFLNALGSIFSSEKTRRVITSLIAQSRA